MRYALFPYRKHPLLLFLSSDSAVQLPLSICCDKEVCGWISGDHVILLQMVEGEKYLIVIITAVHNKGGLSEKSSSLFDRIKRDGVYRFVILLSRRMDPGKNTDRMIAGSQGTGLCYMISFL